MRHTKLRPWGATFALVLAAALHGPGQADGERYHDSIIIVLDASGSMSSGMRSTGDAKMRAAKIALKKAAAKVPKSTHIGLLVFSAKGITDDWVYPLGPLKPKALMKAIERPQPGGGTPLGKYMRIGTNRLLRERAKQFGYGSYRLLIVTDGQASDASAMTAYVPRILARGITVDVIGVDMKGDHVLATKVHSYRRADDPKALDKALAEVLAEVSAADSGPAGEDAFELLAAIPADTGAAMLRGLSRTNNAPIVADNDGTASLNQILIVFGLIVLAFVFIVSLIVRAIKAIVRRMRRLAFER